MSSSVWSWPSEPSVRLLSRQTLDDDYPGINISRIRVGGDLGGVVFVVGMTVCLLVGLPETRGFFAGTLGGGAVVAAIIAWWHRRHERSAAEALISLKLSGR